MKDSDFVEVDEIELKTPSPLTSSTGSDSSTKVRSKDIFGVNITPRDTKSEERLFTCVDSNFDQSVNGAGENISSSGNSSKESSLTDLKNRLQNLPPSNDIARLADRVASFSRYICRKHENRIRENADRIEETEEPEEKSENQENLPQLLDSRDARARRRARIRLESLQAQNQEMMISNQTGHLSFPKLAGNETNSDPCSSNVLQIEDLDEELQVSQDRSENKTDYQSGILGSTRARYSNEKSDKYRPRTSVILKNLSSESESEINETPKNTSARSAPVTFDFGSPTRVSGGAVISELPVISARSNESHSRRLFRDVPFSQTTESFEKDGESGYSNEGPQGNIGNGRKRSYFKSLSARDVGSKSAYSNELFRDCYSVSSTPKRYLESSIEPTFMHSNLTEANYTMYKVNASYNDGINVRENSSPSNSLLSPAREDEIQNEGASARTNVLSPGRECDRFEEHQSANSVYSYKMHSTEKLSSVTEEIDAKESIRRYNDKLGNVHEVEDVTKIPTLAINSQDISYSTSRDSKEYSGHKHINPHDLIRALSDVSLKEEDYVHSASNHSETYNVSQFRYSNDENWRTWKPVDSDRFAETPKSYRSCPIHSKLSANITNPRTRAFSDTRKHPQRSNQNFLNRSNHQYRSFSTGLNMNTESCRKVSSSSERLNSLPKKRKLLDSANSRFSSACSFRSRQSVNPDVFENVNSPSDCNKSGRSLESFRSNYRSNRSFTYDPQVKMTDTYRTTESVETDASVDRDYFSGGMINDPLSFRTSSGEIRNEEMSSRSRYRSGNSVVIEDLESPDIMEASNKSNYDDVHSFSSLHYDQYFQINMIHCDADIPNYCQYDQNATSRTFDSNFFSSKSSDDAQLYSNQNEPPNVLIETLSSEFEDPSRIRQESPPQYEVSFPESKSSIKNENSVHEEIVSGNSHHEFVGSESLNAEKESRELESETNIETLPSNFSMKILQSDRTEETNVYLQPEIIEIEDYEDPNANENFAVNQSADNSTAEHLQKTICTDSAKSQSETITTTKDHETPKMSSSASKLNEASDSKKNSPHLKKKSQERFPFTMSEVTKFKVPSESGQRTESANSKSLEKAPKLDIHPSITRLANEGLEETPAEIASCFVSEEKEKRSWKRVTKFVRKFTIRFGRSKKEGKEINDGLGSAKVIYENRACHGDSLVNSSSEEECLEKSPGANRKSFPGNQLRIGNNTARSSVISSGKSLKKKESYENIAIGHRCRRYDRDDVWVRDVKEVKQSKSRKRLDKVNAKDRYSRQRREMAKDLAVSRKKSNNSKKKSDSKKLNRDALTKATKKKERNAEDQEDVREGVSAVLFCFAVFYNVLVHFCSRNIDRR